jgi:hypothetical protein
LRLSRATERYLKQPGSPLQKLTKRFYPDGSRIMEVSTKALPKEAFQVAADFKAYLAGHGIVLGADQSAKTRNSLEFFSARLKEEGQGG